LAAVQLRAFAGCISKCVESGVCSGQKFVFASSGSKFSDTSAEDKAAIHVASNKAVMFKCACKTMSGWPSKASGGNKASQCLWACFKCTKHYCRFIEYANAARIVHMLILPSQHAKWQDERDLSGALLGARRFCALVQR
jgi:hypothetical protein